MNTFCSYFNQGICSSCSSIEQDYSSQVDSKNQKLKDLLSGLGSFELLPPVKSAQVGFRNKAKFSITGSLDHPIIGLTGEEELDQGREITNCPLHHPEINQLLTALPAFIKLAHLQPYQIKMKTGELKGAIVYFSSETKEIYLRLILRSKESLDRIKKHSATLLAQYPKLTCLSANIQPVPHAILEGDEEIFFTAQHFIQHRLGDVQMTLHPQGFVQTNQEMAYKLYATAAEWTKDAAPATFMELFSGQGAFSFFIQKHVNKAIGVEINPEAVERANLTAKQLGLQHLSFVAQDAAQVEKMVLDFNPELILVNPPRRGLAGVNQILKKIKSRYFIYSSCNAETLAQDLIQLKDHFTVVKAQVFDMFPNTDHFETLVLLESNAYRI